MPRHGTAIAEAASPPEPVPAASSRPVGRSRGLSGWPIRRKLAALVAPPLVIILAAGALLAYQAFGNLQDARRAQSISQVIVLSGQATLALQEEINQAIVGASVGGNGPDKNSIARLDTLIDKTDTARTALLTALGSAPAGGWSVDVTLAGKEIENSGVDLEQARKDAKSNRNYSFADTAYQRALRVHLGLTNSLARDLTTATTDGRLASAATTISAMSGLADAASSERTEGAVLLAKAPVVPNDKISAQSLGNYLTYIQTQAIQASIAQRFATSRAIGLLTTAQSTDSDTIERYRRDIIGLSQAIDPREDFRVGKAIEFSEVAGQRVQRIDNALTGMADDTNSIAEDVARAAMLRTALVVGIALAMLVIGILLAAAISKTVTVPLRRLRSAAVEAATVRLPAAVRQIERQGPDAVPALPPVLPPGTAAGPETLEVASAVDGLTAEALRLATAQVRLRQAIDEAFVSMSRRSPVHGREAAVDHRRAGEHRGGPGPAPQPLPARPPRRPDAPLQRQPARPRRIDRAHAQRRPGARSRTSSARRPARWSSTSGSGCSRSAAPRSPGPAAGGLIHLLAELLDNAAMYSPPTSPILLTAPFMPDGGLHLEVTDSGVGIPPAELAELNARLGTPGTLDAQVPSRMGLFVVARLAQRGGLRVRLSPRTNAAGTVAEVVVPPALVAGGPAGETQPAAFGDIPAAPAGPAGPGVVGPAGRNGFGGLGSRGLAVPGAVAGPEPSRPSAPSSRRAGQVRGPRPGRARRRARAVRRSRRRARHERHPCCSARRWRLAAAVAPPGCRPVRRPARRGRRGPGRRAGPARPAARLRRPVRRRPGDQRQPVRAGRRGRRAAAGRERHRRRPLDRRRRPAPTAPGRCGAPPPHGPPDPTRDAADPGPWRVGAARVRQRGTRSARAGRPPTRRPPSRPHPRSACHRPRRPGLGHGRRRGGGRASRRAGTPGPSRTAGGSRRSAPDRPLRAGTAALRAVPPRRTLPAGPVRPSAPARAGRRTSRRWRAVPHRPRPGRPSPAAPGPPTPRPPPRAAGRPAPAAAAPAPRSGARPLRPRTSRGPARRMGEGAALTGELPVRSRTRRASAVPSALSSAKPSAAPVPPVAVPASRPATATATATVTDAPRRAVARPAPGTPRCRPSSPPAPPRTPRPSGTGRPTRTPR